MNLFIQDTLKTMENLKIEIKPWPSRKSEVWLNISGTDVAKVNNNSQPMNYNVFKGNSKISFVKFEGYDHVSVIIDNKEISLPKQVLIEALEFLTDKKMIDTN